MIKKMIWPLGAVFCLLFGATVYWGLGQRSYIKISSGFVDAASIQIRAQSEGTLIEISTKEGDFLQLGAPLYTIENPALIEKQKKAKTSLVDLAKELQIYKLQSEQAMQNYLADLGVLSEREVDQHLQTLQEAQMKMNQIQAELDELRQEANLLQLESAKISVSSPCQGVTLKQSKLSGDQVILGETILTLFDLNQLWIEASVPEQELHLLAIGQKADIFLPAYPHQKWSGSLSWIGPATVSKIEGSPIIPGKGLIPIKITLAEKDFPAKPGLSAEVRLKIN